MERPESELRQAGSRDEALNYNAVPLHEKGWGRSWRPVRGARQPETYIHVLLLYDLKYILTIDILETVHSGRHIGPVGFLGKFSGVSSLVLDVCKLSLPDSRISWNPLYLDLIMAPRIYGWALFTFVSSRNRERVWIKGTDLQRITESHPNILWTGCRNTATYIWANISLAPFG